MSSTIPKRHFAQIPNIDDLDLNLYQYRLMGHYRHVCGAKNKPCEETTAETAQKTGMSTGKVSVARKQLMEMGRITITYKGRGLIVVLVDIWEMNNSRLDRSPGECVHGVNDESDETPSPDETVHPMNETPAIVHPVNVPAPTVHPMNATGEAYQESFKNQESREKEKSDIFSFSQESRAEIEKRWSSAFHQFEMQLDRASFDTYLRGAALVRVEHPSDGGKLLERWVIRVRNQRAADMCTGHLYRMLRRILSDISCLPAEAFELVFQAPEAVPTATERAG